MKHLLITILAIIFCASVFAQENQLDVIYLTNGNVIRGIITEKTENNFVRLSTTVGNFVFSMNDIEKMEKEPFGENDNFTAITENIAKSQQPVVRNVENTVRENTTRVHIAEETPIKNKINPIQQSVFLELLGSSHGIYNIGYDCAFWLAEKHKIAIGTGFHALGQEMVRGLGLPKLGGYIQANYLYGKKHHLEVGYGVTLFSEYGIDRIAYPFVRIGYRFQESDGGFFRIAFTPYLDYNAYDRMLYIGIWGGIAFGFTF